MGWYRNCGPKLGSRHKHTDLVIGKWRDIVLQDTELVHVVLTDNVGAVGQHCAQGNVELRNRSATNRSAMQPAGLQCHYQVTMTMRTLASLDERGSKGSERLSEGVKHAV